MNRSIPSPEISEDYTLAMTQSVGAARVAGADYELSMAIGNPLVLYLDRKGERYVIDLTETFKATVVNFLESRKTEISRT